MKSVIKRGGDVVPYDKEKIAAAILKAFNAAEPILYTTAKVLADRIANTVDARIRYYAGFNDSVHIEKIQDEVETALMEAGHFGIAKAYIIYREKRSAVRDCQRMMLDIDKTMDGYLEQSDWRVNENANVNYSLGGLILHNSGAITANYWLKNIYPPEIAKAHRTCAMHIHDLSMLASYCAGHSLRQLIQEGLGGVQDKVASKPARHLSTLVNQMVNFLGIMQNEWAGAQAFSSFDTYLAPFVREDNLSYEQVKQCVQSFVFGVNTPSRWGSQAPFTNITLDWICPNDLKDRPAIVGGEELGYTYGDCQREMDMVNRAFIEVMLEGDADGRGFHYPIPTYNITKDFDWEHPNCELLFEMTAKYGTPYFANFVNSDMDPSDVRSMAFLPSQKIVYMKEDGVVSTDEIRNLYKHWLAKGKPHGHIKILFNGKFVSCSEMFQIDYSKYKTFHTLTLANGYEQSFSYDHECMIYKDDCYVKTRVQDIKEGDLVCVSSSAWNLNNSIGTYRAGKILGYYLAEGWKSHEKEISFAINIECYSIANEITSFFNELGCRTRIDLQPEHKIIKVFVYGEQARGFVEQFVRGDHAIEKRLNNCIWNTSDDFRKGVFDGYLYTDGCAQHGYLAHTTNKKLCKDLIILCSSIGKIVAYSINENNWRSFNGGERERFTSYKLMFREYKMTQDNNMYYLVPVKKNEAIYSKASFVYNFTVETNEHLFELPNGIITPQCCRLRLDKRELRRRGGGLFGADEFTGSIGVVTINLPQIAYLSSSECEFYERLDKLMTLAKDSLEIKRKTLNRLLEGGLYPYTKRYLGHFNNHFSTIGVCGMNEACLNLFGETIASDRGHAFTLAVLDYMRRRMQDFQEETGNLYNLEATPAESTSYRLAKHDKEMFPDIIASGDDEPFYTNSTQLPVDFTDDVFDALDMQDDLQCMYTGGTVFHVFLGDCATINTKGLGHLIKTIAHNYKLPYFSISPTYSICPVHGYIAGEHFDCPICKNDLLANLLKKRRELIEEKEELLNGKQTV